MSEDTYIYEAIDVEPAITESEVDAKVAIGEYHKVTWEDDGRLGDGYFVRVGERGMIGLAMTPELDENRGLRYQGVVIQANPLDEEHRDSTIETELRTIVDDFGIAPDGTTREFSSAIYIQKDDAEYRIAVEGDQVLRTRVGPSGASSGKEPQLTLSITKYEADLLRQMIALDIHDHKAGDGLVEAQDPEFNRRRVADSEALLAKLNDLIA